MTGPREVSTSRSMLIVLTAIGGGLVVLSTTQNVPEALAVPIGLAVVAVVVGVRRFRPEHQGVWWAMGVAMGLCMVGAATLSLFPPARSDGFQAVSAMLFLLGTLVQVLAMGRMASVRRGGWRRGELLDGSVVATATFMLIWKFVVEPRLGDVSAAELVFSTASPVLAAVWVWMVVWYVWRPRPAFANNLIVAAVVVSCTATFVILVDSAGLSNGTVGPVAGLWPMSFLLIGAAACHPSMRRLTETMHAPRQRRLWTQACVLSAAVLVPPLVASSEIQGEPVDRVMFFACEVILIGLVLVRMVLLMRDNQHEILERHDIEQRLLFQAGHDALTGLANRVGFEQQLDARHQAQAGTDASLAVLFLDLDRFKAVNDTHGHAVGDRLLAAIGRRLQATVRDDDFVARFSSDEFRIVVGTLDDPGRASALAERLRLAVREPVDLTVDDTLVNISTSASIGVAVASAGSSIVELVRDADLALHEAKRAGRDSVVVFENSIRERVTEKARIEAEMKRALEREEFCLHYQPQYDLRTGRIDGFEALIRWNHPTRGLLAPGAFLDIAEESGFIVPLGDWVLRRACRQVRAWQDEFGDPPPVSVNAAAAQLTRPDFAAEVISVLEELGLPPSRLQIEVTETALLDDTRRAGETLKELQRHGVLIAVDDFGTGYFSLSHLRDFPVDILKIDQRFVDGMTDHDEDRAIVVATLGLASALHMNVVAEGVETEAQLAMLQREGCEMAQGYLLGRPGPADGATELLAGERSASGVRATAGQP